jgi:uncharacterized protein YndB with AHSA1/START domain
MTVATTPVVRIQRTYKHPPERVFDAWLDPVALGEFMRPGRGQRADAVTDPRVGGRYLITMLGDDVVHPHTGEYLEIDRPNRLVFTWHSKATGLQPTTVTLEFRPAKGGGCDLTLTHVGVPEKTVEGHRGGWTAISEVLETYLNI